MADENEFLLQRYFLVQWEDRLTNVIDPKHVVAPKKDVAEYQEGDLIEVTYLNKKYQAVISEIHRKYKSDLYQNCSVPCAMHLGNHIYFPPDGSVQQRANYISLRC